MKRLVVVQTKDAVLIADRNAVQDVKKVVEQIKADGRHEHRVHREVYRPSGEYDSIDAGDRYQVKRITVKPGEGLSVQMHHHRAEHWVVVTGTAKPPPLTVISNCLVKTSHLSRWGRRTAWKTRGKSARFN
ncbi:hypothetical protein ACLB1Q_01220 [Escherichia coli]